MKRAVTTCVLIASLLAPVAASASDDGGYDGGNQDQRRCHRSENCRGSFSPGPFDRSPVDIHDNQVCISPDCSHKDNGNGGKKNEAQG